MKSFVSILFAILLTELAHAGPSASRLYFNPEFDKFLKRLEKSIKGTANVLPFALQINVIEDLENTFNEFKDNCVSYDFDLLEKTKNYAPVIALNRSINYVFNAYKDKAKDIRDKLDLIQIVDPIGLIVCLTKQSVIDYPTSKFIESIEEFLKVMYDRMRLFASRANNKYPSNFRDNKNTILHWIPDIVREDITNEWMPFSARTVDCFGKIAMQQFSGITMYPISYYENVENFQPHKSSEIDDIQILAGIFGGNRRAHAMCIYYQASNKFVLIYDSMDPMIYKNSLDPIQKIILDKLYPFKKDIIFIKPKSYQDKSPSCAIFAIMYATMLFLKLDPANTEIKLNCVHGDETLFMRLHILKMFAERKLSLMDDGMKKDCSLVTVPLAMKKFKPHTGIHCLMRTQKARC